jgi:hypothetical protein
MESAHSAALREIPTFSSDGCRTAIPLFKATLEEALGRYGASEIFKTDPGSQFTAEEFTAVLETLGQ